MYAVLNADVNSLYIYISPQYCVFFSLGKFGCGLFNQLTGILNKMMHKNPP